MGFGRYIGSVFVAAGVAFSGGAPAVAQDAAKPLVIGVVEDRSGGSTFYSQESVKAIKLFADMINDGEFLFAKDTVGGEPGILGRKIELIFEDDENNPNNTVVKARRLLERGAQVLFFLSGSGATTQGRVVCTEQKVLCLAPTNVSQKLVEAPNNEYIFTIAPQSALTAQAYIEAWKKLGYKRVAGVRDSTATSKIVGDAYQAAWEAAGFETVAVETVEVGAPDANAQMLRVRNAKPDVIMDLFASASEAAAMYRSKSRLNITTPTFASNTLTATPHIWQLAGDAVNGTLVVDTIGVSNPNTNALRKAYDGKYGANTMVWLHPMVWDGLIVVKKAAEAAGSTDGTALRDEIVKMKDFPSSFGQPGFTLNFGADRHNGAGKQGLVVVEFADRTPSRVWDVYQP